jgi:hypothetical protein
MVEKRRRRRSKKPKKRGKKKRSRKKRKSKKRRKKKSKRKKSKKRRKKRKKKSSKKKRKSKRRKRVKKRSGKKKKGGGNDALKVKVMRSSQKSKHLKAVFTKGKKKVATVHFGPNKKIATWLTGCSSKAKADWCKKNAKCKKLKNCKHPGALEYHLCYGDHKDLAKNLEHFKAKYKLA